MELHAQIACAMPIELMKKGVDWRDRAVYTEAALHCRAELTDGVIHRNLLATWMQDMPIRERAKRLDSMAGKHALVDHPDGWAFPEHVWAKWGRMRADVDASRDIKRQAGVKGNHVRHHVAPDGEPSARCPLCIAEHLALASHDATAAIAERSQNGRKVSPEPEPEPEPESKPESLAATPAATPQRAPTFAEFWTEYPRKVSKLDAEKLWCKLTPAERTAAIDAVPHHVEAWAHERPPRPLDKVMHPDKWLRGRHWDDDVGNGNSSPADDDAYIDPTTGTRIDHNAFR